MCTALGDDRHVVEIVGVIATYNMVSRFLVQQLSEQTGQSFIFDNKGGASGLIGTALLAKADPDGYMIGVVFDRQAAPTRVVV